MKDYEALSKKHFDGQAADYDRRDTYYYSRNGKISCRDVAGQIKELPYESLLDVGCGTGFLMELLIKQRPAHYCGADLSDEMIRVAKEKRIDGAEFVVSSADKLPYPDETFDIVTCSQSFHHYPYPDKAMAEALCALRADSTLCRELGRAAWERASRVFDFRKSAEELRAVYENGTDLL